MSRPRLSEAPYLAVLVVALFLIFVATKVFILVPPLTPPGDAGHCTKDYPMNGLNPAAVSKINWVNGLAFVVAVASVFGFVIPDEYQKTFLEVTATATPLITVVLRSFFTGKADA